MPKYVYFCKECKETFEVRHSLQKTCTICELCDTEGNLERKPTGFFLSKKQSKSAGKSRPGEVVKTTIEEAREELRMEQQNLQKREYKTNE